MSDYHHVPGIRLTLERGWLPPATTDASLLAKRRDQWNIKQTFTDPLECVTDPGVDAVIIATPNFTHHAIAVAAAQAGKHIMCEKPLSLSATQVREMFTAARDAGVVHMTAFTYRFARRCAICGIC